MGHVSGFHDFGSPVSIGRGVPAKKVQTDSKKSC
jgi:hypothetical protein